MDVSRKSRLRILTCFCSFMVASIFVLNLAGCASSSLASKMKAPSYKSLDDDSYVYLRIPVKSFSTLIKKAALEVTTASEGDVNSLVKRIDEVYIGYGCNENPYRFEIVAEGNVPSIAFSSLKKQVYDGDFLKYTYYIEEKNNIEILKLNDRTFGIAKNTYPLVKNYENSFLSENDEEEGYEWWFNQETDDGLFYIKKNDSALQGLLGISLPLNYNAAYGRIIWNGGTTYALDINLSFKDSRVAKALETALGYTARLLRINVKAIDDNTINISGFALEESQIIDLLKMRN